MPEAALDQVKVPDTSQLSLKGNVFLGNRTFDCNMGHCDINQDSLLDSDTAFLHLFARAL